MRFSRYAKKVLPLFLIAAFVGALAVPGMGATPKIYKMKGKITAIDLEYNTVVVDVPIGKKTYTVAGPLAKDAVLKKGNKTDVTLKDFQKGESVVVEWEVTEKGHIVKQLIGR